MNYHVEFDIELLKNPFKGSYIALEGVDGSGKTSQVNLVANYFKSKGREVVITREPRKKGLIGDLIHKVLLGEQKIPSQAIQYLFTTDRIIHYETVIVPALKEGKTVLSDRCFWSALVYGILDTKEEFTENNLNWNLIAHSILSMYHRFIPPDKTFYLEISKDTAMKRLKKKSDLGEIYETKEKVGKAVEGYDMVFNKFKENFIFVDGEKPMEQVKQEIIKNIEDLNL